jgi:hypothetical protein
MHERIHVRPVVQPLCHESTGGAYCGLRAVCVCCNQTI